MSGISTHILDISSGKPAQGIVVRFFHEDREIASEITDTDGRCRCEAVTPGPHRIVFEIGAYFPGGFYPEVSIAFIVRDASVHYHVPLLISPFGYTTYRGS
jgi:5-hydroxyisourate hydrolase